MAPKIAVIFYSLYGHTNTLADTAVASAKEKGAEVELYQIPETLSKEVLGLLHAAPRREDIPVITPDKLIEFDGYIFVIPTRYGRAVAQFSHFFDATGGLWTKQSLSGKFATVITSTGTQNGGQETTAVTTIPFFTHHGINYVPLGYISPTTVNMTEIKGGAPWGSGTLAAADGSRQPSPLEIEEVTAHAKHFTDVVTQFKRGAQRAAAEAAEGGVASSKAVKEVRGDRPTSTSAQSAGSAASSASGTESQKKKKRLSVKGIVKGVKKLLS
ncbi:hypothetical protein FRB99_006456 [Tulasnella sp. 403]|nr:hypothetical protein FRB99_006456 [Tulasnella sp. 403]